MATTTAKKPAGKKIDKLPEQTPVKKKLDLHKALQEHFGFDKFKGSRKRSLNPSWRGMIHLW